MDIIVSSPFLVRQKGNMFTQKPPITDGSNDFNANTFVVINSGALKAVDTGGVLVYGWVNSPSRSATIQPPASLPLEQFDQRHYPFDCDGATFVINITDASGNIGQASGAPTLVEAVIGSEFGLKRLADGRQCLNVDDTINKIFKVVGWVEDQASTDYNGRVYAQVIQSKIQA